MMRCGLAEPPRSSGLHVAHLLAATRQIHSAVSERALATVIMTDLSVRPVANSGCLRGSGEANDKGTRVQSHKFFVK